MSGRTTTGRSPATTNIAPPSTARLVSLATAAEGKARDRCTSRKSPRLCHMQEQTWWRWTRTPLEAGASVRSSGHGTGAVDRLGG